MDSLWIGVLGVLLEEPKSNGKIRRISGLFCAKSNKVLYLNKIYSKYGVF